MQQAIEYAEQLDVPSVFTTTATASSGTTARASSPRREVCLSTISRRRTSSTTLYNRWKGIDARPTSQSRPVLLDDGSGRRPRYYQRIAINRMMEAIAARRTALLLVMATGTGKTYTAAQIIWRFMEAFTKLNPEKSQARVLFLADRNILIDQTMMNDFTMFKGRMAKLSASHKTIRRSPPIARGLGTAGSKVIDKSFELYLSLYQAVTGTEDSQDIYKQFSPDFFDL